MQYDPYVSVVLGVLELECPSKDHNISNHLGSYSTMQGLETRRPEGCMATGASPALAFLN